jgi:hypothetical protein
MGRKPLPPGEARTTRAFKLKTRLYPKAVKLGKAAGLTFPKWVESLVTREIEKEERKKCRSTTR